MAVAASYARGYLAMGITPLYFGVTTIEEAAGDDIDWRFSAGDINVLSSRIQEKYAYEFSSELRGPDPLTPKPPASDQRPKVVLYGGGPIPRTHTGKVQRRKLVALFERYDDCRGALVMSSTFR
jgi:hypothetical protein